MSRRGGSRRARFAASRATATPPTPPAGIPLSWGSDLMFWNYPGAANVTEAGGVVTSVLDLGPNGNHGTPAGGVVRVPADPLMGGADTLTYDGLGTWVDISGALTGFVPANGLSVSALCRSADVAPAFQTFFSFAGSTLYSGMSFWREGGNLRWNAGPGSGGADIAYTALSYTSGDVVAVTFTMTPATLVGGVAEGAATDTPGTLLVYVGNDATPVLTRDFTNTLRALTGMSLGAQIWHTGAISGHLGGQEGDISVANLVLTGEQAAARNAEMLARVT